jgi:hypothetical protein
MRKIIDFLTSFLQLIVSSNTGTILQTCLVKKGWHELKLMPLKFEEKGSPFFSSFFFFFFFLLFSFLLFSSIFS